MPLNKETKTEVCMENYIYLQIGKIVLIKLK